MARRIPLGAAFVAIAAGLAACGDAGRRRDAAAEAFGRWLGGEAAVSSVGPAEHGRYEARGVAWKGALPGRAASADVMQGEGAVPSMATLREAEVGTGLTARRMGVEPRPDGAVSYRLDRGRLDAWGMSIEFAEAVVEPHGADRVGIRMREARLAGDAPRDAVAGAALARAFAGGAVSGEVMLSRRGGEVEAEGRLAPETGAPGRQLLFRIRLAGPGTGLSPFPAERAALAGGSATFAPGPGEPMSVVGEAALAEAVATVALSVDLTPTEPVPLDALASSWAGLVAGGAVRVSRAPAREDGITTR